MTLFKSDLAEPDGTRYLDKLRQLRPDEYAAKMANYYSLACLGKGTDATNYCNSGIDIWRATSKRGDTQDQSEAFWAAMLYWRRAEIGEYFFPPTLKTYQPQINDLRESLKIFKQLGYHEGAGEVLYEISYRLRKVGDLSDARARNSYYRQALEAAQQQLQEFKAACYPEKEARALNQIGVVINDGSLEKPGESAEQYYRKAIERLKTRKLVGDCKKEAACEIEPLQRQELSIRHNVEENLVSILLNKPASELSEKDTDLLKEFLEFYTEILENAEGILGIERQLKDSIRICKKLGDFESERGNKEESLSWKEKALALFERAGTEWRKLDPMSSFRPNKLSEEATIHYDWGELLLDVGQDSEAAEEFKQALRLWEKIIRDSPDRSDKLRTHRNLARLHLNHPRDDNSIGRARQNAEAAIKLANSDEDRAKSLLLLAEIAERSGDYSAESKALKQAWQIVEKKPELIEQQAKILVALMTPSASSQRLNITEGYNWAKKLVGLIKTHPDLAQIYGMPRQQMLVVALSFQAFFQYAQGYDIDGERTFDEARELAAQQAGDPGASLVAKLFFALSNLLFKDWDEGKSTLDELVGDARTAVSRVSGLETQREYLSILAAMFRLRAAFLTSYGEYQPAKYEHDFLEAARISHEVTEPETEIQCYLDLADIYLETGSPLKLEELIEKIKKVEFSGDKKENGQKKMEAARLIVTGLWHERRLEMKQAEDCYHEAAKQIEGLKDALAADLREHALVKLSDLLHSLNRKDESEKVEAQMKDNYSHFFDGATRVGGMVGMIQGLNASLGGLPDASKLKDLDRKAKEEAAIKLKKAMELTQGKTDAYSRYTRQYLLRSLGEVYFRLGEPSMGEQYFTEAVSLAKARWRPSELAAFYSGAAEACEEAKLYEQAAEKYDKALYWRLMTGDQMAQVKVLKGLMNSLDQLNRRKEAIFYGKWAVNILQGARARASYIKDQIAGRGFFTSHADVYQGLIRILFSAGDVDGADDVRRLESEERSFLRERDPKTIRYMTAGLPMNESQRAAMEVALKIENPLEEFRICDKLKIQPNLTGEQKRKRDQSCANATKLRAVEPSLSKSMEPMLRRLPDKSKPQYEEFHSYHNWLNRNSDRLRENGQGILVIHAFHSTNKKGEPRILFWLTTPSGSEELSSRVITDSELNNLIGKLADTDLRPPGKRMRQCGESSLQAQRGESARSKNDRVPRDDSGSPYLCDARPTLGKLYDLLFRGESKLEKRIEQELAGKQSDNAPILLWSLHGILRRIPINALYRYDDLDKSKGRYLVEIYNNVRVFSRVTPDDLFRTSGKPDELSVLAAGVSKSHKLAGGGNSGKLKDTFRELQGIVDWQSDFDFRPVFDGIKGFIPGKILNEDDFRWDNFQTLAQPPRFNVLHLTSHYGLGGPEGGGWLLFGDGEQVSSNGMLAANVFRGFRIVCLSACQTGTVGAGDSDGSENFAQDLHWRSGVQTVISTLFNVPEVSSPELMKRFYEYLIKLEGTYAGRIEALRRAQLDLLQGTHGEGEKCLEERSSGKFPLKDGEVACDPERPWAHPYYWAGYSLSGHWH